MESCVHVLSKSSPILNRKTRLLSAQGLESDSKSICHSKQMYFYPHVISNLQMGANEAQRSAKRHDLEHRLSLRILLRIHREKEYWEWLDLSNS